VDNYAAAMSIPVELDSIAVQLERFATAYLLTTSGEKVKAVAAAPVLEDGRLRVAGPGRGSLANAGAHPDVTLMWPPTDRTEPAAPHAVPAAFTVLPGGARSAILWRSR